MLSNGIENANAIAELGQKCATLASYLPKSYKTIGSECTEIIFKQLSQDESIPYEDRIYIASNVKQIIKHSQNQKKITDIANKYLSGSSQENIQPLNEDWFDLFLEECKTISDVGIQEIWGKILSEECLSPNTIKKSFLIKLKSLDSSTAIKFNRLCNCIFKINADDNVLNDLLFIEPNNIPNGIISGFDLIELQSIGLISVHEIYGQSIEFDNLNPITINYFDDKIIVGLKNKKLSLGRVILTSDGKILANIIEKQKEPCFLNYLIKHICQENNVVSMDLNGQTIYTGHDYAQEF